MERTKKMQEASPSKSPNGDAERSCENSVECSTYLTYDILRMVFQYLRGHDLSNAAMVCKSWYEAASGEQSVRGPVSFMAIHPSIANKIKDLYIKPRLGILFISRTTGRPEETIRSHHMFSSDCEVIRLYCQEVIRNKVDVHKFTHMLYVCLFLPRVPNVNITTYLVNKSKKTKYISEQLIERINCTKVNDETSICLMLFCNNENSKIMRSMIADIRKSGAYEKIDSLWGGMVDLCYMKNSFCSMPCCIGVLISGAIKTWSMVIDKKCNTKEQIEKRLRSFKNRVTLKKHSIGFMCASVSYGNNMHNDVNVESTIFKTIFPDVPLVGFSSSGDVGKDTMDFDNLREGACLNNQSTSDECKRNREEILKKKGCTSYMILTYD